MSFSLAAISLSLVSPPDRQQQVRVQLAVHSAIASSRSLCVYLPGRCCHHSSGDRRRVVVAAGRPPALPSSFVSFCPSQLSLSLLGVLAKGRRQLILFSLFTFRLTLILCVNRLLVHVPNLRYSSFIITLAHLDRPARCRFSKLVKLERAGWLAVRSTIKNRSQR